MRYLLTIASGFVLLLINTFLKRADDALAELDEDDR